MYTISEICRMLAVKEVLLHTNHDPTDINSPTASTEFYWRRIARIYSSVFHTPLRDVYDLPQDFVLCNVFEHQFEQLADDNSEEGETKWFDLLDRLADTEEEAIARSIAEHKDKVKGDEFANQVLNEEKKKEELIKKGVVKKAVPNDYVPYNIKKQIEDAAKEVQKVLDGKSDEFSMKFDGLPRDD